MRSESLCSSYDLAVVVTIGFIRWSILVRKTAAEFGSEIDRNTVNGCDVTPHIFVAPLIDLIVCVFLPSADSSSASDRNVF